MSNKKISNFDIINKEQITSETYISAVQRLADGTFKNIKVPISALSNLWGDDIKDTILNGEYGGAINVDAIHDAALRAAQEAIANAEVDIQEALDDANRLINDLNTGNTETQKALDEALRKCTAATTIAQQRLTEIEDTYVSVFGSEGVVKKSIDESNAQLKNALTLLKNAQDSLNALANGEITPSSITEIKKEIDGITTYLGHEGTWVNKEGTLANHIKDYIDTESGVKNLEMETIDGERRTVTSFKDYVNTMQGVLSETMTQVKDNTKVSEVGREWLMGDNPKIKEFVKTTDFTDPKNTSLRSAVKEMTDSLISQSVKNVTLQAYSSVIVPANDFEKYLTLPKGRIYWFSTSDPEVEVEYSKGNKLNYHKLTTDGIEISDSEVGDNVTFYFKHNADKNIQITALVDKYFTQSNFEQLANLIKAEVITDATQEDGTIYQKIAQAKVTDEEVSAAVTSYLNTAGLTKEKLGQLTTTDEKVQAFVGEYIKDKTTGEIQSLSSLFDVQKDKISQEVLNTTFEKILELEHPLKDNKTSWNVPLGKESGQLPKDKTYFIRYLYLKEVTYRINDGAITSIENGKPLTIPLNATKLVFSFKSDANTDAKKEASYINISESVGAKYANFEITPESISECISDDKNGKIWDSLKTSDMKKDVLGIVSDGYTDEDGNEQYGFLRQTSEYRTPESIVSAVQNIVLGGDSKDPFVQQSEFTNAFDNITSKVDSVGYVKVKNPYRNVTGDRIQSGMTYDLIVPYENEEYTLFLQNPQTYRIFEIVFNGVSIYRREGANASDFSGTIKPLTKEGATIAITFLKRDGTGGYISTSDIVGISIGYPVSVETAKLKIESDNITSQVSDFIKGEAGATSLKTAVLKITADEINSTVAEQVDGKLSNYSTIKLTSSLIASTVGGVGYNLLNNSSFSKGLSDYKPNQGTTLSIQDGDSDTIFDKSIGKILVTTAVGRDYSTSETGSTNLLKWLGPYIYPSSRFLKNKTYTFSTLFKYRNLPVFFNENTSYNIDYPNDYDWSSINSDNERYGTIYKDLAIRFAPNFIGLTNLEQIGNARGYFYIIDPTKTYLENELKERIEYKKSIHWNNGFKDNKTVYDFIYPMNVGLLYLGSDPSELNYYYIINKYLPRNNNFTGLWLKVVTVFDVPDGIEDKDYAIHVMNNTKAPYERWFKEGVDRDKFRESFAICHPMLNEGELPLSWTSDENPYSTIAQTKNQIDLSINNIKNGLGKVGINIDATNPDNTTISLDADNIVANAKNATFEGAVNAKSLRVSEEGTKASIQLIIYDPANPLFNSPIEFTSKTPVLVATDENGTSYIVDLIKILKFTASPTSYTLKGTWDLNYNYYRWSNNNLVEVSCKKIELDRFKIQEKTYNLSSVVGTKDYKYPEKDIMKEGFNGSMIGKLFTSNYIIFNMMYEGKDIFNNEITGLTDRPDINKVSVSLKSSDYYSLINDNTSGNIYINSGIKSGNWMGYNPNNYSELVHYGSVINFTVYSSIQNGVPTNRIGTCLGFKMNEKYYWVSGPYGNYDKVISIKEKFLATPNETNGEELRNALRLSSTYSTSPVVLSDESLRLLNNIYGDIDYRFYAARI